MKTNLIKGLFVVFALISCDSKKDKQDENQIPNSVYDNNKYYIEVDTKYSNNKNVLDFLQFKILPPIEEGELEIGIRTRTLRKQDSKIINYSLCGTYVSNRQSYTEDEYNDGIIENAINIDIHMGQGFISELESLDKNKKRSR